MSEPWEDVPHIWPDERAFLNWMRSQTRRIWSRHPIKVEYVKSRQVPVHRATNPDYILGHPLKHNTKHICQCEHCEFWFAKGRMEVDHIHGGKGFNNWSSFLLWQDRMLRVGFSDIRHLCKECHLAVTLCQKYECTMEQLPWYQAHTRFKDAKAARQKLLLQQLDLPPGKNSTERVLIHWEYIRKQL